MPQKKIKRTITKTINLCDYKGCEEEVDFFYVRRFCDGCGKVFCDEHLFDIYENEDDKYRVMVLCSYCSNICDEKIMPLYKEKWKIIEEKNKEVRKLEKEMKKICEENYKKEYNK
ncbi:MAG TPA: hypothetical protein VMZ91_10650 [Candidatus Paceibacterota bacterium]|nr:hypothetical protein [Candidatus Paceibacterota bacterium]